MLFYGPTVFFPSIGHLNRSFFPFRSFDLTSSCPLDFFLHILATRPCQVPYLLFHPFCYFHFLPSGCLPLLFPRGLLFFFFFFFFFSVGVESLLRENGDEIPGFFTLFFLLPPLMPVLSWFAPCFYRSVPPSIILFLSPHFDSFLSRLLSSGLLALLPPVFALSFLFLLSHVPFFAASFAPTGPVLSLPCCFAAHRTF